MLVLEMEDITKHDIFSTGSISGYNSTLGRSKDTNRSHGVVGDVGEGYPGYVSHPDICLHPTSLSQDHQPSHPPTQFSDLSCMPFPLWESH